MDVAGFFCVYMTYCTVSQVCQLGRCHNKTYGPGRFVSLCFEAAATLYSRALNGGGTGDPPNRVCAGLDTLEDMVIAYRNKTFAHAVGLSKRSLIVIDDAGTPCAGTASLEFADFDAVFENVTDLAIYRHHALAKHALSLSEDALSVSERAKEAGLGLEFTPANLEKAAAVVRDPKFSNDSPVPTFLVSFRGFMIENDVSQSFWYTNDVDPDAVNNIANDLLSCATLINECHHLARCVELLDNLHIGKLQTMVVMIGILNSLYRCIGSGALTIGNTKQLLVHALSSDQPANGAAALRKLEDYRLCAAHVTSTETAFFSWPFAEHKYSPSWMMDNLRLPSDLLACIKLVLPSLNRVVDTLWCEKKAAAARLINYKQIPLRQWTIEYSPLRHANNAYGPKVRSKAAGKATTTTSSDVPLAVSIFGNDDDF